MPARREAWDKTFLRDTGQGFTMGEWKAERFGQECLMADGTVTGAVHPDTFSGPVLRHRFASAVSSHSFPTGKNYLGFLDEETEIKELSMCGSGSSQTWEPWTSVPGVIPGGHLFPSRFCEGPGLGHIRADWMQWEVSMEGCQELAGGA